VGRRIASLLSANDVPFVVADQNRELVEKLRAEGLAAVWGDASEPSVLVQAHIARARVLAIATPDLIDVRPMIDTARMLNPSIQVVVRGHDEAQARLLTQELSAVVFLGEQELAQAMAHDLLRRTAAAH
jgi:CPA2 family monovalent cation:H+ antiporter-2